MIPELGHFSLFVALAVATMQTVLPMVGTRNGNVAMVRFARPAAQVQCALIFVAYLCLSYAFVTDDFSVRYVALAQPDGQI